MLPSRSGRSANWSWFVSVLSILFLSILISTGPAFAQAKGGRKKKPSAATSSASPGEQSLTNIPLPVGHEAKGLVLPDFSITGDSVQFDTNTRTGHLVGNVKMVITQQSQLMGKENE